MKKMLLLVALLAAATASWCDELLTEPQMRMYAHIRSANTWLGIGLCMEGAGILGLFASMSSIYSSYYYGEEDVTMLYASVGVFGIGMITQMIATTSIGMSSIRLGKSIAREGSDAPRPKGAAVWSLLSAGSLGVAFLCSSMMYSDVLYSDFIFEAVGILELTSIVSAGVTYFSVKGYGAEIGWAEYRQARETALMSPENEFRSLAFAATGRPHLRIPVPLLSIGY